MIVTNAMSSLKATENSKWVMKLYYSARVISFLPTGIPHRFTDFSDTMSTWVMFYGPDNGENANSAKNQLDIVNFIVIACVNQAALKIGQHDAIKHRLPQATRGLTHAARHERQYAQDS